MEHPTPIILAPIVNERGAQLSLSALDIDQRGIARRVSEHEKLHANHVKDLHAKMDNTLVDLRGELEVLRGDLVKAHARIEVLESRWYERLTRWVKGVINATI